MPRYHTRNPVFRAFDIARHNANKKDLDLEQYYEEIERGREEVLAELLFRPEKEEGKK